MEKKTLEELADDLQKANSQVAQTVAENETELRDFTNSPRSSHSFAKAACREILIALDEWKAATEKFLQGQANLLHPKVAVIVEDSILDNGQGKRIDDGDHGLE